MIEHALIGIGRFATSDAPLVERLQFAIQELELALSDAAAWPPDALQLAADLRDHYFASSTNGLLHEDAGRLARDLLTLYESLTIARFKQCEADRQNS